MSGIDKSRRTFLKGSAVALAALPLSTLLHQRSARAEPRAEDGHAHDYVNEAADASGHPRYEEGQLCENCAFWGEAVEDGWGRCTHPDFDEVLVKAEGWCSVYAPAS
ncbi:MAG: high-potential iron-sulfur protein [Halorhodospira halophila]|uniref:high-potential iron-sulfur protein n=1 Tax=Halorhodospira TaxID=85108 RepID=UPI00191487F9|nr:MULTISPECIES: high-potential iron-sulfur protein [Halorhodospira]MBK5943810.1 histidine kinase [Halorhodospira halophila]MCC3750236.1 high-potential iron-sulfur protein [Halorhodospira halophila]MCG5532228.1 high-potential iron-sulfur protein [Halorhodospira sp. 9621]MCG5540213.1 high-potential iron-sulfur protein [Halorhodospira sp. M39old]MCG5545086.1 high-potential iron-sulfur protein [Halorhodospira sp. M38]